jgi:hypothetical protein
MEIENWWITDKHPQQMGVARYVLPVLLILLRFFGAWHKCRFAFLDGFSHLHGQNGEVNRFFYNR